MAGAQVCRIGCGSTVKYRCISCNVYVCNRPLCSVAREDENCDGWMENSSMSYYNDCFLESINIQICNSFLLLLVMKWNICSCFCPNSFLIFNICLNIRTLLTAAIFVLQHTCTFKRITWSIKRLLNERAGRFCMRFCFICEVILKSTSKLIDTIWYDTH